MEEDKKHYWRRRIKLKIMEIEKLKSILGKLYSIADAATICPSLDDDTRDEAKYALELIIKAQDIIRMHEIDCLLENRTTKNETVRKKYQE